MKIKILIVVLFILTGLFWFLIKPRIIDEKQKPNIFIEQKIVALIDKERSRNKTEFIDKTREFVYQNSVKEIDSKHDEYAWNISFVLEKLYSSAKSGKNLPHLSCGPRVLAMKSILDKAGIESRIVFLFSDDFDSLKDHTVLEVFNPDSLAWEIQDLDSNSYFINRKTKERASVSQLILDSMQNFELISTEEKEKGWQDIIVRSYLKAAMYNFSWTRNSKSVVIYNPTRFLMNKSFPDDNNLTFLQIVKDKYKNPAVISNLENSTEFESIFYDF